MTMLHGNSNESCHFILLVCKALHVKIAICTTRLVGKGSLLLQTVLKINQMLSLKCSYLKKKNAGKNPSKTFCFVKHCFWMNET